MNNTSPANVSIRHSLLVAMMALAAVNLADAADTFVDAEAVAGVSAPPPAVGGQRMADVARANFARAVAASLGFDPMRFVVVPLSGAEELDSQAALKIADLRAWSALDASRRVLVNGFAGPGPGVRVAFEGFAGGPGVNGGLSALMEAMQVLDPARRLPIDAIVERVAFCLNRTDRAEMLFDAQVLRGSGFEPPAGVRSPSLRTTRQGVLLTYFAMVQGLTGTFDLWKVGVSVAPGYRVQIEREAVRP